MEEAGYALRQDEPVHAAAFGVLDSLATLVIVTNTRVLVVGKAVRTARIEDLALHSIISVAAGRGMYSGSLTIQFSRHSPCEVTRVNTGAARAVATAIRQAQAESS